MQTQLNPAIFKSYDVRGIYPSELNEDVAYGIGRCFVPLVGARAVVVGRDMRPSGARLFEAFARGATEAGADVVYVGMVSTDALYFAVGKFGYQGGVMITASNNPAQQNGMKFTSDLAQAIAIDAGNGMAGETVPHVFKHLPCEVIPLYFELDGSFPNHPASPIEPENMADLQAAVRKHGCDLGVAFDGDADRMFIVDEHGNLIDGSTVTALVALNTLKRYPGCKILYNLICSRSVPELIEKHGGIPIRSQVGHSLIKKTMREQDVVFGGEHSGHFYFRDNWYADSGMIALMQCLELFSESGKTVSETIAPIDTRFRSGEINSTVSDIPGKLRAIEERYSDAQIDHLDGVTVSYPDWW